PNLGDPKRRLGVTAQRQWYRPSPPIDERHRDADITSDQHCMIGLPGNAMSLPQAFHTQATTGADQIAPKSRRQVGLELRHIVRNVLSGQAPQCFGSCEPVMLFPPPPLAPVQTDPSALRTSHL